MENLKEAYKELANAFDEFDNLLRRTDKHTWERWKAGGKQVTDEFISMYPSAEAIAEGSEDDSEDEDEIEDAVDTELEMKMIC